MTAGTDELVASSNPALVVVTTAAGGERAGCLVGFHSQSSIEPFRYAVWISKANHTYGVAAAATHFAVHFLDDADHELAAVFGTETGDSTDKFSGLRWTVGDGGVPLLDGIAVILFAKEATWDDGGDHACFVGRPVIAIAPRAFDPLRLGDADDIEPGHAADEDPGAASPSSDEVEGLQDIAAGFGHELTPEQVEAFNAEHESAREDQDAGEGS